MTITITCGDDKKTFFASYQEFSAEGGSPQEAADNLSKKIEVYAGELEAEAAQLRAVLGEPRELMEWTLQPVKA
jgi:hypothetical protein